MKKILFLLLVTVLMIERTEAQMTNAPIQASLMVSNACVGEDVLVTASGAFIERFVLDGPILRYQLHFRWNQIDAVGQTTGTHYNVSATTQTMQNGYYSTPGTFTARMTDVFHINAPGKGNNFVEFYQWTVIYDMSNNLRVYKEWDYSECR